MTDDITGDLTLSKLVNIDLNGKKLDGNMSVTDLLSSGTVTLSNTGGVGAEVTGTLTVNTPNADFVVGSGVTVTGLTTITDVNGSTFTNNGNLGAVTITDNDASFVNKPGASLTGDLTIAGANSDVRITATEPIANVVVTGAGSKINVVSGTIETLTSKAANVELTGSGTVTTPAVSDGGTLVDGEGAPVKGTETPEQQIANGTRLADVANGVNIDNIAFLSKRVNTANKGKTKVAQVHLNKENLIAAYQTGNVIEAKKEASDLGTGKYVKTYKNSELFIGYPTTGSLFEVETPVYDHSTLPTGALTIDLSIEGNDLLLGNTTMSVDLFKAIKSDESTSYQITVIKEYDNIEKLRFAKIEFNLVDGKVIAKLINS